MPISQLKRCVIGDISVSESCNILISSAGRRVALMRLFRASLAELGVEGQILAADLRASSSAFQEADRAVYAPRFGEPSFIPDMLEICHTHHVRLLVPTVDTELELYAAAREQFAEIGTLVTVSDPETVVISCDKERTHKWLVEEGIPTPRQTTPQGVLDHPDDWSLPLLAKPRWGSSSIGVMRLETAEDVRKAERRDDMIVQTIAPGREYTVDVFVNRDGRVCCTVPRLRIETRGGEITKGVTVRSKPIQKLARWVCASLPGAQGVFNVQIFSDDTTGALNVIEFNPRFGGGYPLAHQAGGVFTLWLIEETLGRPCGATDEMWSDGVVMLRYDNAIFCTRAQAGLDEPPPRGIPT